MNSEHEKEARKFFRHHPLLMQSLVDLYVVPNVPFANRCGTRTHAWGVRQQQPRSTCNGGVYRLQCRPTRKKHLLQLRLKSYCRRHSELKFLCRHFLVFPDERGARFLIFAISDRFTRVNCTISYHR